MSHGDSFLPRIQSVFYAVFDVRQGPKIMFQVPEGLISLSPAGQPPNQSASASLSSSSSSSAIDPETLPHFLSSRNSSNSILSSSDQRTSSRSQRSPQKQSNLGRGLFNFDEISRYVIPPTALCGRLVTCATRNHKIIGFPVELIGNYDRVYFRYNLCFVFKRSADLSCYEPIVRKVGRVLSACEEESAFLSSPETTPAIYTILEQLYEDLNSYSETSIPVDKFNSIELKILPFYPNPPEVKDWAVPLTLIDLSKTMEPNWDLTMAKVCKHIDGTNYVSKIAHLADCDLDLTRRAISHLLFYQVIMTIDIFQYSNMYTLRKSIQRLADEPHVKEECGPYVVRPGRSPVEWPKLLRLYSRLKPGKTVYEWMETYNVQALGIDVRRFTSFGVIKGFLRRVYCWPVLLPKEKLEKVDPDSCSSLGRRRARNNEPVALPRLDIPVHQNDHNNPPTAGPYPQTTPAEASVSPDMVEKTPIQRRESAAEKELVQLQHLEKRITGSVTKSKKKRDQSSEYSVRGDSDVNQPPKLPISFFPPSSPAVTYRNVPSPFINRRRLSRSPSTSNVALSTQNANPATDVIRTPPELAILLDGEHHTDELQTMFGVGWPVLERWLVEVGGGSDGDFGRIVMIYR